jgi:XTP/dITP diphosphohydrolase
LPENPQWLIATGNAGKLAEFRELLAPFAVVPVSLRERGISSPEETGLTFIENALIKARHAALESGLPAIADDSGLCVTALDGEPGLRSARFAGPQASDARNISALLQRMDGIPLARRTATFVCVIVAMRSANDPDPIVATGHWHGRIALTPRGEHGFGYDPIFEIPELDKTAAELNPAQKSALSHRAQASAQLLRAWPPVRL